MVKISAVIITYNEEKRIKKCLESLVGIADEIVVVDSFSTDRTETICQQYDVHFIQQEFLGYIEQKNFALSKAKHDYIIALDGDEALSDQLKVSLQKLKTNWKHDGYYANRFNNYCGQWIKYSDWYPNKKMRFFKKDAGSWQGINPHDNFILDNPKSNSFLKGDILHWVLDDYSSHIKKTENFSTIAAQAYYDQGKRSSIWKIIYRPAWAFFKAYVLRLGFLDGLNGFIICVQTYNTVFYKYIKLYELQKRNPKA
ncbi:glycosyltransferase family 2 protein [Winogradskyella flava]|uniref:Glycosyltransferase family 2 protein n=1 Tax=Winogradskyella flava TaxID=1884876 RepID=A0A842IY12_9FLAO|nr:glycosyltransferase family 2 protein [Winogradskyella flava]MBC2845658.1 glycosyltransferase family 2 protein [Winogradskyella flava]